MSRLAFRDVTCRRGGRILFSEIDFALAPGESLMVRGPNGAGKSSLIRLAAGLLNPAAGSVEREGAPALSDESLALDRDRTLIDALAFWVERAAARDALARLALDHLAEVPVRMLSTGQRKRASLARVAASGAALWLLDEPANGLDDASVTALGALMAEHLAAGGILVAASHSPLPLGFAHVLALGPRA